MATLIPRKQIEEFQEFTGSLNIGGDLNVSQSLFVSQSFFLGNDTGSISQITSSLKLTGSLEIDGQFLFVGDELNVTASDATLAQDTLRFGGLTAPDFGANIPTLYVSSTDGNDNNDGRTIQFPLRTIKKACEIAEAGNDGRYGLPSGSFSGYVIRVQGGTYFEDNPVIVPKNTTIWGSGLRITKVQARNLDQDLFWVNSGVYLSEMTFGGLRLYPDQIEPERGFAVAFQPGAFITTSPYVQNCSQISNQENSFLELYEEIPPGGGGLYVNGDVIAEDSPLASMVLDAYTQISPNVVGCLVNGRGFIQLVSFFTNFSYYAIRVNNGGHATLNNSNISFGLYGMYASGSRPIDAISGGNEDARLSVRNSYSIIIDSLRFGLEEGLPTTTILNTDEGIKTTAFTQSFSNETATTVEVNKVKEDFNLISNIVKEGVGNYPTLLAKSSIKGYDIDNVYNISGTNQVTASTTASVDDLEQVSSSFATILSIFEDGTGSYSFTSNNANAIYIGNTSPIIPNESVPSLISQNVSSSFGTVITVLSSGSVPALLSNVSESVRVSGVEPTTASLTASVDIASSVSASFSIIYNILDKGTGSAFVDVPNNHTQSFDVTVNSGSTAWLMNGEEEPTLTLFRGKEYRFNVSGSVGNQRNPFFIRTAPSSGFVVGSTYGTDGENNANNINYNDGVVNNGDDFGLIIFTVPFDSPNTLYYVSQNDEDLFGTFQIVNNSETPQSLVTSSLTYPPLVQSGSVSSSNATTQSVYQALIDNIGFIQSESIAYISSSWADFSYNQDTCARDIGFIVSAVANDLIYGGNEGSINAGIEYYRVPSDATTTQKEPTLTAVKFVSELSNKLIQNQTFVTSSDIQDRVNVWNSIRENKSIIQSEVITYISSSWSNFDYNDVSCSRDVGYILDAVATDTLYGGNERAIEAGNFYFKYPSLANVDGDGDSLGQLNQTVDGIRYAAGMVDQILSQSLFVQPDTSTSASYVAIFDNKSLIQQETVNFVNATYPFLDYNQVSCSRDVGYIVDAIITDLRYGGNERAEMAGRFYYDYPSVATTTQKTETRAAMRYANTLINSIVQNTILETPRLINNTELGIKVGALDNVTSSFSGTSIEEANISGSWGIVSDIINKGTGSILSAIAKNRPEFEWSLTNPVNVSDFEQVLSTSSLENYTSSINTLFQGVANVVSGGLSFQPTLVKSVESLTKINDITQITSSLSVSSSFTSSISSSFGTVLDIIVNGTGSIPEIIPNSLGNILVTGIDVVTGSVATGSVSSSISSSYGTIINILENGTGSLPTLVENTESNIYFVTTPFTSSVTGSSSDVSFVSGGFAIVLDILNNGTGSYTASNYGLPTTDPQTIAAYVNLKSNIGFIQSESIAYISSSWSTASYDQDKCIRDIGYIVSGAAEDLLYGVYSSSVVNGQFYYEYPSQATGSQLGFTSDGINYARRLAEKVIVNTPFVTQSVEILNGANLLINNKELIQSESVAYVSSSWSQVNYDDTKCIRDVGYILDAVITDLKYGGNERAITAGEYYYLFPSQATGNQLFSTVDAIEWASDLSQKIVVGQEFTQADSQSLEVSRLLKENGLLIGSEVVSYVSSSWSEVTYNQDSCSRDVRHILDAARTDLVYGGNERAAIAGRFYYDYPSAAIIGGVPSETQQKDPTVTGIEYGADLAQSIALSQELQLVSQSLLDTYDVVYSNKELIKQNTIKYINTFFPFLVYNEASCSRDTGFIIDGVLTDLVYGGNQRSRESARFYYLYPSLAIQDAQKVETFEGIVYAGNVTEEVSINSLLGRPEVRSNTSASIRVTDTPQVSSSFSGSSSEVSIVSSSFSTVSTIIKNGLGSLPTIVENTENNIKVTDTIIVSSSLSGSVTQSLSVSSSYAIVLDIVENGTGSLPTLVENTENNIKVTEFNSITGSVTASQSDITFISGAFAVVLDIVENGSGSYTASVYGSPSTDPQTVSAYNILKSNIGFIQSESISYISSSWSTASYNELSCSRDIGFIVNGAAEDLLHGVVSASVVNGKYYYEFPSEATGSQLNFTLDGINYARRLAQKVVVNTLFQTASQDVSSSYYLLTNNKEFIQDETIQYLSSSWSTFDYNDVTCRRDVGYIIDAVRTDLLYGGNERSRTAGLYYYLYPSSATVSGSVSPTSASQLYPTLDGINYSRGLAQKVVVGTTFVTASQEVSASQYLIKNNKDFIQDEVIQYISSSWSEFDYNDVTCRRDVGYILDAVSTDLLYGGNERSATAGEFYYLFPSSATVSGSMSPTSDAQLYPTLDGIHHAAGMTEKIITNTIFQTASLEVSASVDILRKNRSFIQQEVIEYVSSSWSQVVYNQESCSRDTGYILDASITDLLYGGEKRSVTAGEFYFLFPSNATVAGVPSERAQKDPTLTGVRYGGKLSSRLIFNPTLNEPSASRLVARDLLQDNKLFIQKETIAFLSSSWSTLDYNEVSCSRDLGFILDAVSTDLIYGGNEASVQAGNYYYLIPSVAIQDSYSANTGQKQQTADGINFGRGIAEKVISQTQLVFAGEQRREAVQRLRDAKEELQRRALAYTNGAFPDFAYNEASCSRDTGFIVDALATDLLYGGNERGIEAAQSYYLGNYASADVVINEQLNETIETNRYLRTRAEFIAANAPKEDFGSLIVATGIDYSYNGSGVTFKALPPNQGGSGVPNPDFEITELGGGRIFFTSGNQDGDFRIGTGLTINQATGTLVGRTFSKSLFSLVTPFSLALEG